MPVDNELYNRLYDTWWDENTVLGSMRNGLNPGRFGYFQQVLLERLHIDLQGKKALDVGCGGGLLAEEFARLGCAVTGIDPSELSLETARRHARESGLQIDYQVGTGESLPFQDASFDIVYCCDVLEHVQGLGRVIAEIARVLKKGGIFLYDTINRTFPSRLVMIKLFQEWQATSFMPPNLHEWKMFITPGELRTHLRQAGLELRDVQGLKPSAHPLILLALLSQRKRGKLSQAEFGRRVQFQLSRDTSILYAGYAILVQKSFRKAST
ncbi:MAG: 3-demethylubiquinone-9 3-O-methyltransferase [Ktedonobacteraceae bacterium]|nr:3-demethylubiquinone-9 3-O-methyltransferase [Ktedonobacteraceae bacterium]